MNDTASIVSKVWSFCHTLRDDGVSYGDYLEQLTYLLFLKMADEYSKIYKKDIGIPVEYNWDSLKTPKEAGLETHYITLLRTLGRRKGMIGQIFVKSHQKEKSYVLRRPEGFHLLLQPAKPSQASRNLVGRQPRRQMAQIHL